jgi:hypothetical protein
MSHPEVQFAYPKVDLYVTKTSQNNVIKLSR